MLVKYAAELFGTFVLVFAGLTTAVIAGGQVHNVGVALAFGLSLMAMAFTVGPISGCHINPAVTLGMLLSKRIRAGQALGYMVAQAVGAIVAAGWALEQLWLFIVAPLLGGALAAGVFAAIRPAGVQITSKQAEQVLPSQQRERRQAP